MKKIKNKSKIGLGTVEDFFERGKKIAQLADKRSRIPESKIIHFEDPSDLTKFLTTTKLSLMKAVRKNPDSITELSKKLHRKRAAVSRDVNQLEAYGLVETYYEANPGHGRVRIVKAMSSTPIYLQTTI